MCPRLIKFIFLAEIHYNFTTILEGISEVNEMRQEVTYCIEDYVLSQRLVNSHCLFLGFVGSLLRVTSPDTFHCLTEICGDIVDVLV